MSYLAAVRRSFFSNGHRRAGEVLPEKDSSVAGVNTADKTTRRGLNRRGRVMRHGKPFFKTSHVPCGPFPSRGRGPLERVKTTWRRPLGEDELSLPPSQCADPPRALRVSLEFDQLHHFGGLQSLANEVASVEITI